MTTPNRAVARIDLSQVRTWLDLPVDVAIEGGRIRQGPGPPCLELWLVGSGVPAQAGPRRRPIVTIELHNDPTHLVPRKHFGGFSL
jgi:hypothetical protein